LSFIHIGKQQALLKIKHRLDVASCKIERDSFLQQILDANIICNRSSAFGKSQQLAGEGPGSFHRTFGLLEEIKPCILFGELQFCQRDVSKNHCQNIVKIVGDAPSQNTQAFQLFHFLEFFLNVECLGYVPEYQNDASDASGNGANGGPRVRYVMPGTTVRKQHEVGAAFSDFFRF